MLGGWACLRETGEPLRSGGHHLSLGVKVRVSCSAGGMVLVDLREEQESWGM